MTYLVFTTLSSHIDEKSGWKHFFFLKEGGFLFVVFFIAKNQKYLLKTKQAAPANNDNDLKSMWRLVFHCPYFQSATDRRTIDLLCEAAVITSKHLKWLGETASAKTTRIKTDPVFLAHSRQTGWHREKNKSKTQKAHASEVNLQNRGRGKCEREQKQQQRESGGTGGKPGSETIDSVEKLCG